MRERMTPSYCRLIRLIYRVILSADRAGWVTWKDESRFVQCAVTEPTVPYEAVLEAPSSRLRFSVRVTSLLGSYHRNVDRVCVSRSWDVLRR